MPKIRVLRLLEYVYDSVETMEKDMARWSVCNQRPPHNSGITIKSVTLPLEVLSEPEET